MIAPLVLLAALAGAYDHVGATGGANAPEPTVQLAFVGDISPSLSMGRAIASGTGEAALPSYPFGDVMARIAAADVAMGNLECVTSPLGADRKHAPALRAPAEAIARVRDAGFALVSVANNHALDLGQPAFDDMIARLDAGGLPHVGTPQAPRSLAPLVRVVRGLKVGFLAYYEVDVDEAYRDVERARAEVDFLVVYNHWGREHSARAIPWQVRFGHGLIDRGADLVVGAHTHLLQEEEWYRGKLIVYGLGNFAFPGMEYDEPHRTGGFLEVLASRHAVRARRLYRVRLDDGGAPHWLDDEPTELAFIGSPR